MTAGQDAYAALTFYSLELQDAAFLHQHIVDAYSAQHADQTSRPMAIVFSLLGLYLYLEKGFTGRQVQRVHTLLASRRQHWIAPPLPPEPAPIGVAHVMAAPPGIEREAAVRAWCQAVWESWSHARPSIVAIARDHLAIEP